MNAKSLVIIPTYNEKENIKRIIGEILDLNNNFEILIVDDNSPDGTGKIIEKIAQEEPQVHVIHRPKKLGFGTACITGFKWALQYDYQYIFKMDADLSHNPKYLPKFLQEIRDCDLIIGSRYKSGISIVNWPISRLILSLLANKYTKLLTGLPINDCTSGFNCFRRKVLESIDLNNISSNGYAFQIEIHTKTYQKGFRLKEVPIIFIERRKGKSKMGKKIIWEAFFTVLRLGTKRLLPFNF